MKHIGPNPPPEMYRASLEIDCQCARCGSSIESDRCELHDCFDDDDFCTDCDNSRTCVWHRCLSSPEWCQANPLPGREEVPRGAIEWYTMDGREP